MTEENSPQMEQPPPPEKSVSDDPPRMSGLAALGNVFIEPGNVFDDMRRKPRFLLAGLIIIFIFSSFQVIFIEKVGLDNIVRARIESSKRGQSLTDEQKQQAISQQSGPIAKYITYAITPVISAIIFVLGTLLYWGLSNAMGGSNTFTRSLSVWVYAGIPPSIIFLVGNMIVLFLKPVEEIDLAHSQNGLLKASFAFFIDPNSSPVIAGFLGAFDLFTIWGWALAAIGLQRVGKISSGAAWAVVLMVGMIKVAISTIPAFF